VKQEPHKVRKTPRKVNRHQPRANTESTQHSAHTHHEAYRITAEGAVERIKDECD
jgi:hypothetical protein